MSEVYTLAEVADALRISYHAARRIFLRQPGVLNTGTGSNEHYAPWVKARQERLEEDVRRTFKARVVPMRKKAG